jgi:hypothetical protein
MHAEASGRMAALWNLWKDIQTVLTHHHDYDLERMDHPLVAAICFSEAIAAQLDGAMAPADQPHAPTAFMSDPNDPRRFAQAEQALGIDEHQSKLILERCQQALEALQTNPE